MPSRQKLAVFVTRKLPDAVETRLMELFDGVCLNTDDAPLSPDALRQAMAQADVLLPTVTDRLDDSVLSAAGPKLRLIANFGNGVDHIDVTAAAGRGIMVTNTPKVLTEDTADMCMALILDCLRRVGEGERLLRAGQWMGWSPSAMLGRRLAGKRLGIIGMGRIGSALARRARAFGLSIHYHNRAPVPAELEAELEASYWPSLDQMLARMDIISVNCPHTPATFHLLSKRRLDLLPRHAVLINTARGEVVDEAALVKKLRAGEIAGAGLDVYEREPLIDPRLRALDNVVLLPHMGSATLEARLEMGELVLVNIKAFADGHRPPHRVLPGEY